MKHPRRQRVALSDDPRGHLRHILKHVQNYLLQLLAQSHQASQPCSGQLIDPQKKQHCRQDGQPTKLLLATHITIILRRSNPHTQDPQFNRLLHHRLRLQHTLLPQLVSSLPTSLLLLRTIVSILLGKLSLRQHLGPTSRITQITIVIQTSNGDEIWTIDPSQNNQYQAVRRGYLSRPD